MKIGFFGNRVWIVGLVLLSGCALKVNTGDDQTGENLDPPCVSKGTGCRSDTDCFVSLQWDHSASGDARGYKLYWGGSSGTYVRSVDVGYTTCYTIEGLPRDLYYFAATAYNNQGESGFSNEVSSNSTAYPGGATPEGRAWEEGTTPKPQFFIDFRDKGTIGQ